MPTSKKNKTTESTALVRPGQWDDPFKEYGEAATQLQLKIPIVKIEYMASKKIQLEHPEWQRGKFSLSIGEQLDQLEAALIGLRYGRICWLADFDPNNADVDPDCKSDNGVFPSPTIDKPLTDVFAEVSGQKVPICVSCHKTGEPLRSRSGKYVIACPFAKWESRAEPPKCRDFFTLLLWEHQLNLPLIYSIKGSGIKHLTQLHMDMIRAAREIPEGAKMPPSCYIKILIRAVANSNWFEPNFKLDGYFDDLAAEINYDAKKELVSDFEAMNTDDFAFDKAAENMDDD